jgi:hypothetical protein
MRLPVWVGGGVGVPDASAWSYPSHDSTGEHVLQPFVNRFWRLVADPGHTITFRGYLRKLGN